MKKIQNLAIIPARGGSKRIPRKNIKDFLGKPIISYSIEIALACKLFDEIMVSTDDNEIAKVSKQYGAKIPFMRSQINSNDYATTMDVIEEVYHQYFNSGIKIENILCIYPTAPLANPDDIKKGFEKFKSNLSGVLLPITRFSYTPLRGLKVSPQNKIEMWFPENQAKRSQDLEKIYHDAGQWYWIKSEFIGKPIFGDQTDFVEIPEFRVQDIDNETDWKLAELKYKMLHNEI